MRAFFSSDFAIKISFNLVFKQGQLRYCRGSDIFVYKLLIET